jgi:GT2 family glycosyltransferase
MKITFCIPSKNNLRYLKNSVRSIKQNSTQDHDIVVYVDSDNDGTEVWLIENQITYLKNNTEEPKGIAFAYNRCIEAATTEIVCMFHADMFMGKGFDTNTLKHLKPGVVVSATRIEPPLHPHGLEKIVKDFGMYPEDFSKESFDEFVEQEKQRSKDQVTYGIFAPWACYKSDLTEMGLHDEFNFHSYQEDSDIFNRMILSGMKCVQSRDALVYHLTCRGGQFQDGVEQVTSDRAFHQMKNNAARNYIRKWGSWVKNDEYQHPIVLPKYSIGFVVSNCGISMLEVLEPWCSTIYIQDDYDLIVPDYISKEQPNTKFNLKDRIRPYMFNHKDKPNDILVSFDASKLTQQSFQIIQQLSEIIKESGEVGSFKLDIFTIEIKQMNEYQKNLIVCNTTY